MGKRIKMTWLAVDEDGSNPLVSADNFDDLKKALDKHFGVGQEGRKAECLGFYPDESKFPSSYEGHFRYFYEFNGNESIDRVKVFCIDFFPETKYEVEDDD